MHDVRGFSQFLNGFWAIARPQPRRAFVALGSNLGKRAENIRAAKALIAEIPMTCVSSCSRIYESEPAYENRQDPFANAVIEIKTELAPLILLDELMKIESSMGRNRHQERPPQRSAHHRFGPAVDGRRGARRRQAAPAPPVFGRARLCAVPGSRTLCWNPARFFRYEGVDVKEPEDRVGHVVGELGSL